MNIQREFLYNEEKLVPVQLLRTNYGVAEANPVGLPGEATATKTIEIVFPSNSSNLVFMMDFNTKEVIQVYASPPGTITVNIEIKDEQSYSLFIVSKEYEDGFINGEYKVDSNQFSNTQTEITFQDAPNQIDLTKDGAMVESLGRDEEDPQQWYNYDQYYTGGLVWSAPIIIDGEASIDNYWLIIQKEILAQIDNILRNNDLTSFVPTDKTHIARLFKSVDDIAELMQDKRDAYNDLLGENADKLDPLWNFLNANLPGYGIDEIDDSNYYITYTDPVGQWVDEMGVWADYIQMDRLGSTSYPAADAAGQYMAATDTGRDNPINYTDDEGQSQSYNTGMNDNERHKGIYAGGKGARQFIAGVNDRQWVATRHGDSAGIFDPSYRPNWTQVVRAKAESIREMNESLNNDYGFPLYEETGNRNTNNRNWWASMGTNGSALWDNLSSWLLDMREETLVLIALAGETVWCCPDSASTRNFPYDYDWTNVPPVPDGVDSGQWAQLWADLTNRATTFGIEAMANPDPNLPYKGMEGYNSPTYGNMWYSYYVWYREMESHNTLAPDGCPPCSGDTEDGTTGTSREYLPLAQEAILQNIRYLKNLIGSIDENLWSSLTNSSALILASIIKVTEDLKANPETDSIINITNSTVRNADVEVLWKQIGGTDTRLEYAVQLAAPWEPLSTSVFDMKEDVKMIDLNIPEFEEPGKYLVLIRPKKTSFDAYSGTGEGWIVVRDELNEFREPNYFYGYNSRLYNANEYDQGQQKIIVASWWEASYQYLQLSPVFSGSVELERDLKIDLWSNDFIPVTIEVDVVEHNALTLSYAAYAKKELNTDTGVCTIYDHNGNVYTTLSLGRHSNAGTGGDIIEYRVPATREYTDEY